ncbi:MAG: glycerol-3-phosphate 1-O-acyltransferase PlsY [Oscillospiraceae bacterium]|jgi:glycerol-3-phosphate acyltransferase PlsY
MMTDQTLFVAITIVIGYLLGSLNGAIIASKNVFKKDIRSFGSGNAGLTNFHRTFGTQGLLIVIAVDVLKTVAATLTGKALAPLGAYDVSVGCMLAGFGVCLGHVYPIYYSFRGGKGILSGGTLAWMIDWRVGVCSWGIFLILVVFTQYVSLGSLAAAVTLAASVCVFIPSPTAKILALISAALIIFAHRENIKRLKNGTESKLNFHSGGRTKT